MARLSCRHAEFENGMKLTNPQYPVKPDTLYRLEAQLNAT